MPSRGFKMYGKVVWPGWAEGPPPRHVLKVGRNEPCPCGSGRKYKDCHEKDGTAWLEKLWRDQQRERLKEQGVPWYKRLIFWS